MEVCATNYLGRRQVGSPSAHKLSSCKLQVYIGESAEPTPCIKLLHVLHRRYSWLLLAIGRLDEMSKVVAGVVDRATRNSC